MMFDICRSRILSVLFLSLPLILSSCGPAAEETEETEYAHLVADLMSGFTDSLAAGGVSFTTMNLTKALADRVLPRPIFFAQAAEPLATSCDDVALSACATGSGNGIQTRDFDSCTYNGWTFGGTVTFEHNEPDCTLDAGDSVERTPNFTVEGRRGYELFTYGTSPAQTISRTGPNDYTFSSNAITRTFVDPEGDTVFEFQTETTTDLQIERNSSPTSWNITGGEIQVTNINSSEVCALTASNVEWDDSDFKCPVSGSWSGTCDEADIEVTFSGCGVANFSYNGDSSTISLDRCF